MEMGYKIKKLRCAASLTQEALGERLGVSAQSVSKWETGAALPDITLLPVISQVLGVSIDELFDLTKEAKLRRLESRMDREEELPPDVFREYEDMLLEGLEDEKEKDESLRLLAYLYHHRMLADGKRVSLYGREHIRRNPAAKECQWLIGDSERHRVWDWNVYNHAGAIEFYREVIAGDKAQPKSALPYYYLLDQLLADHRTEEARRVLAEFKTLPGHKPMMALVYEAHIALAEFDRPGAEAVFRAGMEKWGQDEGFLFEKAQFHAHLCQYDKAVECYEASWALDAQRPRFWDALQGIAVIYEIQGRYREAAGTWDRIIECLRDEWGMTEETACQEARRERDRLLAKQ